MERFILEREMKMAKQKKDLEVYTTSFCNKGHRLEDGKPVNHECYIIPPKALQLECEGKTQEAIEVMDAARPWKHHFGIRQK